MCEDMDLGDSGGLLEAIEFRYEPIKWLCNIVSKPAFGLAYNSELTIDGLEEQEVVDMAELIYRRYLTTMKGSMIQRAYLFIFLCLVFFGVLNGLKSWKEWGGTYEDGKTPTSEDDDYLQKLRAGTVAAVDPSHSSVLALIVV